LRGILGPLAEEVNEMLGIDTRPGIRSSPDYIRNGEQRTLNTTALV